MPLLNSGNWNPALHPRNSIGEFIYTDGGLYGRSPSGPSRPNPKAKGSAPSAIQNALALPINQNTDRRNGTATNPYFSHYGFGNDKNWDKNSNKKLPGLCTSCNGYCDRSKAVRQFFVSESTTLKFLSMLPFIMTLQVPSTISTFSGQGTSTITAQGCSLSRSDIVFLWSIQRPVIECCFHKRGIISALGHLKVMANIRHFFPAIVYCDSMSESQLRMARESAAGFSAFSFVERQKSARRLSNGIGGGRCAIAWRKALARRRQLVAPWVWPEARSTVVAT